MRTCLAHRANASIRANKGGNTNTSSAGAREGPPRHWRRHDTDTTTHAHTEATGTPARDKKRTPRKNTIRRRNATYRLAESYCHGRSRTDTGCQTRSGVSWRRPEGGILLGNGRLEFRRNPQTKTRRTPSRTGPLSRTPSRAQSRHTPSYSDLLGKALSAKVWSMLSTQERRWHLPCWCMDLTIFLPERQMQKPVRARLESWIWLPLETVRCLTCDGRREQKLALATIVLRFLEHLYCELVEFRCF